MFIVYRLRNYMHRLAFRSVVGPFFGKLGRGSSMVRPRGIEGIGRVFVGDNVYVADGGLLAAVPHTNAGDCALRIGNGCKLGSYNHIYATQSVTLEDEVLTAGNVYISDNAHGFEDARVPIMHQPIQQLGAVTIGRGSWIGQNVCIIGANVGQGCVIGSNSVVLTDIPDHCVAVGAPARIVRRMDKATGEWVREPRSSSSAAATAMMDNP